MIFAVPDLDIDTSSLDELKSHARIVAGVENQLRAYHMQVQGEIIKRVNASFEVAHVPVKRKPLKRYTRDEILRGEDDEFDFSMDDFR